MIWNKSAKHKRLNSNGNDVDIVQVFCNLRKFVKAFKNLLFKYVITKKKLQKNAIVAESIFSLFLIQKKQKKDLKV